MREQQYVQTTVLDVDAQRVSGTLTLAPGGDVWPAVMGVIDTNSDGRLDGPEMQSYARAVLGDLSLRLDGVPASLQIRSIEFAPMEAFQEGGGEIRLDFAAAVASGPPHVLVFENLHRAATSTYAARLAPSTGSALTVTSEQRSADASRYEVHFEPAGAGLAGWWWVAPAMLVAIGVIWRVRR